MSKRDRNNPAALRNMLDGPFILQQWSRVNSYLFSGYKPVYNQPTGPVADLTDADFRVIGWEPLTPADVSRMTKMVDSYNRLLNKLLPELKAVDVADARAQASAADALTPREKATKLYALLRASPEGRQLLTSLSGQAEPAPEPTSNAPGISPAETTVSASPVPVAHLRQSENSPERDSIDPASLYLNEVREPWMH